MPKQSSAILTAEVIDSSIAYKEFEDEDTGIIHPRGVIKIRLRAGRSVNIDYAYPLNATTFSVPLTGEHVLLIKSTNPVDNPFRNIRSYYYLQSVNIFDNLTSNRFFGLNSIGTPYENAPERTTIKYKNSLQVLDEKNSSKLQPYVGDIIYQSRYASGIRFSSSNTKDTQIYENTTPPWESATKDSPIVTITNGFDITKETYTIENPEEDKSLVYLTSDQKIRITSSQTNLGLGVPRSSVYKDPQVILSSDRVLINAKEEQVILSGKESVTVATPNWAMDMNDFFNAFQDLVTELEKTATAQSPYGTGVGPTTPNPGLTAGIAKIKAVLSSMKQ